MTALDKEEQALSVSIEKGEWKTVADLEEEIKKSKEYAKATFVKDQRMNIRIAQRDFKSQSTGRRYPLSNIGFQYYSQISFRGPNRKENRLMSILRFRCFVSKNH